MSDLEVNLEFTPNPESLKYVVNRPLLAKGTKNYESSELAEKESPLAAALFSLSGVKGVMLGTNFVSVNFANQDDLHSLNDQCISLIKKQISSGDPIIHTHAFESDSSQKAVAGSIEARIQEVLDKEVRPAVAMDGGDIVFEKFDDGVVYLKMQGSCSGCPSSLMTLKMGVETRLKEACPEVQEVIPV